MYIEDAFVYTALSTLSVQLEEYTRKTMGYVKLWCPDLPSVPQLGASNTLSPCVY